MAYGRDAQAEEILKEALSKYPSRQPIRTKLLEIYAGRKDVKAFETVAAELHAATGGEGAEWEKAVVLGSEFDPGNPLYGGRAEAGETRKSTGTQVLSGAGVAAAVAAAPDISLKTTAEQPASPGLDFDLGLGAPANEVTANLGFDHDQGGAEKKIEAAPAAPHTDVAGVPALDTTKVPGVSEATASIDFDFELPATGDAAQTAQPQASGEAPPASAHAPAASADGGGIDFDFNLDLPAPKEEVPAAPLDLSSINLDLGAPGGAAAPIDAHWQEMATKLDLAKAYQDMGDKDGARELLGDVLKEGDATQQQQAQSMLSALG